MIRRNLLNPTGLMLLYSMVALSCVDGLTAIMPFLSGFFSGDLSRRAVIAEVVAFLPPIVAFYFLRQKSGEGVKWALPIPARLWPFVGAVALWVPIAALIVSFGVFTSVGDVLTEPAGAVGGTLGFFAACVLPAFLEELFIRGAVLTSVERGGSVFAVFFSATCFAMLHADMHNFLTPFLAGLVFGALTVWTGSVIPAILAHFCNNVFSYYAGGFIARISNWVNVEVILFAVLALFLILTYVALSQWQNMLQRDDEGESQAGGKVSRQEAIYANLTSIPVILYLLCFLHNVGVLAG